MATKSQRRKEKHKRKRRQKKERSKNRSEQTPRAYEKVTGLNVRHRERVARQTPTAWDGEATEDVAVFDDAACESLSPELADQVVAVREALQHALSSCGDAALERTSTISRSSPLSEWRLFIRGLVPWMAGDLESAIIAWERLNSARRPGRIAIAMLAATRSDLDALAVETPNGQTHGATETDAKGDWKDQLDESLLYHAKLLQRVRFDRAAIRIAQTGVSIPEESRKLTLGLRKIEWLREFAAEYRESEPDLVAALEQVALGRAFAQNYSNLFDSAVKAFVGPKHDRRNRLLTFFYYGRFASDPSAQRLADRSLDEYLTGDLPQNAELSESLRSAIASQIHLNEAMTLIRPMTGGFLGNFFDGREDSTAIRSHLRDSVRAYPANRSAHQAHVEWIESKLDHDRLTKPKRKPLLRQLAKVMEKWSQSLPDDVEPRLWLADHLLENEQTDDAKPHVDWLAASRQDDPRVRATGWKWQLLEAMRLSRRKAWLANVPARLDEAESLWPAWLSRQWLPYLRAALTLRSGKTEDYEQQREHICGESGIARDSLADACMMLGAAQRMRVPAADLKPLRTPVDAAVKKLSGVPHEELLLACHFFWDLQRTGLRYPALQKHGGKIGRETFARLSDHPSLVLEHQDDEQVLAAVLWCSEHRFWSDGYELNLPPWFSKPAIKQHPMFAAAKLNAFFKLRINWRTDGYTELGPLLRQAAQTERDAYYRYWFLSLADHLDDVLASQSSRLFGSGFDPFGQLFGNEGDDDDDDSLPFDPNCDCSACQAAKREYEASQ